MKRMGLAAMLLLVASAAFAGVQYEFIQRTQSDIENIPSADLTGRALIDGDRSRVDFLSGSSYPPGAFVISTNGSRTLTYVDPLNKSYTEVNAGAVAATIGTSNIRIENQKSHVDKLDDHPTIAGTSTDHYRLTISYDMTVTFGTKPLKQSITTQIDKWTTLQYGDVPETFLANSSVKTGNPEIDKLIDLETTKISGLPLKVITKTTLTNLQGSVAGTKLPLANVRTLTREIIITQIATAKPDGSAFAVPINFKKVDGEPTKLKQTQVTTLSFDPPQE